MKQWLEGHAELSDGFSKPLFSCKECREKCAERDEDAPCEISGECFLVDLWWDEKPDWAKADPPPGWELAWETFLLSSHVGFEAAMQCSEVADHDMQVNLIEKVGYLSSNVKAIENRYMRDARRGTGKDNI